MQENELVKIETVNAMELFIGDNLEPFLKNIEDQVMSLVPDTETAKGRKEIASLARKVSSSKVLLDNLGKDLVAGWKTKAKMVDESRKRTRDFLDNLRDRARQPLTDWEKEEEARQAAIKLAKEIEQAHEEAIAEDDLFNRKRDLERREAAIVAAEAERVAKEEAERKAKEAAAEAERLAKEKEEEAKRIREEAIAEANRKAEEKAAKEREEAERAQKEREAQAEAERLRIEEEIANAKAAAEEAEREKIRAAERAKIELEEAITKAKRDAEEAAKEAEQKRLAKEAEEKAIADQKASDLQHRASVDKEALADLLKVKGVDEFIGQSLIEAIGSGSVKHITINY